MAVRALPASLNWQPLRATAAVALAAVAMLGISRAIPARHATPVAGFQAVSIAAGTPTVPAGDSIEAVRTAFDQGVENVEVNFVLTADGALVSGHDDDIGGTCGVVSSRTLAQMRACRVHDGNHVATLSELLAMDFDAVYVDLKTTGREAAIQAARVIRASGRVESTVLMVYDLSGGVENAIAGLRTGLKGYPETDAALRMLIDTASRAGMELVCSESRYLPIATVSYAAERGIALLPWSEVIDDHLLDLIDAGVSGAIVLNVDRLNARLTRS